MKECAKGHGPYERWCRVCDRERHLRRSKEARAAAPEPTHCPRGHLYQPGTWRILSYHGKFGNLVEMRSCIICARAAAKQASEVAAASRNAARAKRTYPGKVNTRRVSMRDRIAEIHQQILDACDRMDLMSAAELAEWKVRRSDLVKEADMLQARSESGNAASMRSKRRRDARQPVAQ